jgi:hypothetical protein
MCGVGCQSCFSVCFQGDMKKDDKKQEKVNKMLDFNKLV